VFGGRVECVEVDRRLLKLLLIVKQALPVNLSHTARFVIATLKQVVSQRESLPQSSNAWSIAKPIPSLIRCTTTSVLDSRGRVSVCDAA